MNRDIFVFPPKHPDATIDYGVSFEFDCANQWDFWTDFSTSYRLRVFTPGAASGYEWEAIQGGRSGGRRPVFIPDYDTRDGSVIWRSTALTASSLARSISGTPVWSATTGINVTLQGVNGMLATAAIGGGIDGEDYAIEVSAITSDMLIFTRQCVLPVRIPVRKPVC